MSRFVAGLTKASLSFLSIYVTLVLLSLWMAHELRTKQDVIASTRGSVPFVPPSSFLQTVDGRGDDNIVDASDEEIAPIRFPLGGAPDALTVYCREDDGWLIYEADRYGFYNDDMLWEAPRHDVVITGDSFAHGACVEEPTQHVMVNEGWRTVSLGAGGNGALTSYAVLVEYLDQYDVDHIFHLVTQNDYRRPMDADWLIDFEREIQNVTLQDYLQLGMSIQSYFDRERLEAYRTFVFELTAQQIEGSSQRSVLIDSIYLRPVMTLVWRLLSQQPEGVQVPRFLDAENQVLLRETYEAMVRASDSRIVFVLLPIKSCDTDDVIKELLPADHVLDLSSALCEPDYFAVRGGHFNSIGYRELANRLIEHLESD